MNVDLVIYPEKRKKNVDLVRDDMPEYLGDFF